MDADQAPVVDKVLDPILPALIEAIYGVPAPAGNSQRPVRDLPHRHLHGLRRRRRRPGDAAAGRPELAVAERRRQSARGDGVAFRPSEMLRLNMSIAPTAEPNSLGVLAGDLAGFPNGRRLADDVLDIAIQAVEGAALTGELVEGLATVDSVDANDLPFGDTFPYVALPHSANVNSVGTDPDMSPTSDTDATRWIDAIEVDRAP